MAMLRQFSPTGLLSTDQLRPSLDIATVESLGVEVPMAV